MIKKTGDLDKFYSSLKADGNLIFEEVRNSDGDERYIGFEDAVEEAEMEGEELSGKLEKRQPPRPHLRGVFCL